jgi:hypothetical protein
MGENVEANDAHAISRLGDSGEQAVRDLVALPLRMLAGTLGVFEAVLRTAADKLREIDPHDERIVALERRVHSLEEETTRRRESGRSRSAARKRTPTAAGAAVRERTASDEHALGSDTAPPSGGG